MFSTESTLEVLWTIFRLCKT